MLSKKFIFVFYAIQLMSFGFCTDFWEPCSDDEMYQQPYVAISLGANCISALHLTNHGIRIRSFPFDWNVTPFDSLCSLIANDFQDFCELKYLYVNNPGVSDVVTNTKYNIQIHHQFNTIDYENTPDGMRALNEKGAFEFQKISGFYQRRITRFKNIVNSGIPIYFFRYEKISYDRARKLYALIKQKFPLSNCFLVCLDMSCGDLKNNWKSKDRIYHFYINPKKRTVEVPIGDPPHEAFTRVFAKLGLLK